MSSSPVQGREGPSDPDDRPGPGGCACADAVVAVRQLVLHGQQTTFREAGAGSGGPVVLLLHGLASSSTTWAPVMPNLGRHAHLIAPDLLGHGGSAKPHSGDYSLGAHAAELRDLLLALDIDKVTVVGHSYGGGVAMQFTYLFPELTERLVLVSSGGLGREVAFALRAATLPGTAMVLRMAAAAAPTWLPRLVRVVLRALPSASAAEIEGLTRALSSFADEGARGAFAQTVRGALNWSGQRLEGTERLYLLAELPVLLVAGDRDTVIPAAHTVDAHRLIPDSRLEIFADTGHFLHAERPRRFARLLREFLDTTHPAEVDRRSLRRQLLRHPIPDRLDAGS